MRLTLLAHSFTKGAVGQQGDILEVADPATVAYLIDNGAARELPPDISTPTVPAGNSGPEDGGGDETAKTERRPGRR